MKERELILEAITLIRTWHGMGMQQPAEKQMWDIYYNNSPEMKPFREYLASNPVEAEVGIANGGDDNPYLLSGQELKRTEDAAKSK